MPVTPTYPGVYIEEIPSGVRTIAGVATSITAFIGRSRKGRVNEPIRIQNFGDFQRQFGGLWVHSPMSYALQHYFLNGGSDAIVIRVVHDDARQATVLLAGSPGNPPLELEAVSEGTWGNNLRVRVDYSTRPPEPGEDANSLFNLSIKDISTGDVESFRNLSTDSDRPRYVTRVLAEESHFVRVVGTVPTIRPNNHPDLKPGKDPFVEAGSHTNFNNDGSDGSAIVDHDICNPDLEGLKQGIWALEKTDLFNLLCIPPLTRDTDIGSITLSSALAYCKKRRAMLLVDAPSTWGDKDRPIAEITSLGINDKNAAIFFPRLKVPDPLKENRLEEFAPCGAVAGIFARTDAARGVWKAPAGIEATLIGVRELSVKLTDEENGQLNPWGINCLRSFPAIGNVVWGARTREGEDRLASEWKYIPVRRIALFIEESLYRGTQWVVFEPNDEPLWAQIRLNIGAFMQNLFRQGAFQGTTPREAYFVKCDRETTTQTDINLGIVNILVGFAPLKPAEFVIIKIQQMAGQITT